MILSPHLITSAALGANFQSTGWKIYLLPIIAIALHFILDRVPHYDYKIKPFSPIVAAKVITDISIGIIIILIIYLFFNPSLNLTIVAIGMFFGVLPDGFLLASFIFKNEWLQKYQRFHNFFHRKESENPEATEKEKKAIAWAGLFTQIFVAIIAIYYLL